jgi:glycosidase
MIFSMSDSLKIRYIMKLLLLKFWEKVINNNVLLILLVLISCSSSPNTTVPPANNTNSDPDPIQYNIPFSGVPDARDAVIYQVNMRCFSEKRNFQGVINRLDSIKSLGINVVYLMPIYPVGILNSVNSPYCVRDYKSVNSEFGSLTDLRTLIDGAHSRGMSVILDWVANHTAWDNSWTSTNKSWYVQNSSGQLVSPNGWNDVVQLNFQNQIMRLAMIKAMKYWVYTANCDGFRCDYADGPPVDFWKQAIDTLKHISTHKLLLLAEGTRSDHFKSGFNYTFGFRFYDQLKNIYSNNQPVTNLDNINTLEYSGSTDLNQVVRYITNHDVNSSDGTPIDLFGGKAGSMAAFVATAYMKGVPMIYNGQEVGYPIRLTFPFTSSTINWTLNPDMVAEYKRIIAFRNNNPALGRGSLTSYNSSDVCAFTKTLGSETVLVISNFRNRTVDYSLAAPIANYTWTGGFNGSSISLKTLITLQPYSYLILKK